MAAWVRFEHDGGEGFGLLDPTAPDPGHPGSAAAAIHVHTGTMFAPVPAGRTLLLGDVRLLPPVQPRTFIGLWNNFQELAAKLGTAVPTGPLYFLKATSSLLAPGGDIRPPPGYAGKVVYEGELGIVIGQTCRHATEAEAAAAIFGCTCVNDVTALDLLHADPSFPQWARAKGCDSFGPADPASSPGWTPWACVSARC